MSIETSFQIVCTRCGCLSIKIDEPVKSSREAIIFCGDCGLSRGTVGALRDLSVQGYTPIVTPAPSPVLSEHEPDQQPATKISTQYAELQRLRQQVKIAEWLANESDRPHAIKRKTGTRNLAFRPSGKRVYLGDERDQKRPS
jgi:hypothetical protein